MKHSEFLALRPSQVAAAALVYAATNTSTHRLAEWDTVGNDITKWTHAVEEATQVRKIQDIKPVYELLLTKIFSYDWN